MDPKEAKLVRHIFQRFPAGPAESAVIEQIGGVLRSPEIIAQTYREARTLEAEELERLRAEQEQLEERLKALRDQGQKLLRLGDAGSLVAEELRRLGYETDTRNARLENVIAQIARLSAAELTEAQVVEALQRLDPLWDELFPGEQARIVRLLVDTVEVSADGLDLRLRSDGLRSLVTSVT